jgi:hypothetical protein
MKYHKKTLLFRLLTIFFLSRMVFFHSSVLYAAPDTLLRLKPIVPIFPNKIFPKQDSSQKKCPYILSLYKNRSGSAFYSKIQSNAEKNFATRKLYGLFFRKQDLNSAGIVFSKRDATDKFVDFANKQINRIEFVKLDAFGQSVFDSTLGPSTWIEDKANNLHIITADFVIKNNLLFTEGDILNPVDFAESEQLLRNLNYIEDANIIVETLDDTTKVNVKVITKDAWSIGLGARLFNTHSSQFQVYDKNIGGLGLGLSGYLFYDAKNPSKWGHKVELNAFNIGGTFVLGNVWYRHGQGYESYAMSIRRDFYSSKALYGGGGGLIKSTEPYTYKNIDSTSSISYLTYDYWIGRSIRVSRKNLIKAPHNVVIAFRFISSNYSQRPRVEANLNYPFQSKEYILFGLSLNQQKLYKENLIYSFGSTEDIPTGFRVHFTSGIEKRAPFLLGNTTTKVEFSNRYYFGNEVSTADVGPWGYLFISARGGGFLTTTNKTEQITTNFRAIYFSNLFRISDLRIRQFARVDYTRGLSRFLGEGEQIFLDNNNGVRGLSSRAMTGTSRLVLNLETIAFSPLFVFGFRFAYFAFCDVGFIGSADDYIVGNQSFTGFGLGVRIRNENLVLNTFQLRLGYYPKLPSNADFSYWLITGQQRTAFESFRAREPQVVPFE